MLQLVFDVDAARGEILLLTFVSTMTGKDWLMNDKLIKGKK
jgi:hypothetical protein